LRRGTGRPTDLVEVEVRAPIISEAAVFLHTTILQRADSGHR
jgi:hypothetical protein